MNLLQDLQERLRLALAGLVSETATYEAMVKPAPPRFGDYQFTCAMALGKALGRKPRDVATELVQQLDVGDALETPEIAGPGFINLRFRDDWLARTLQAIAADARLGISEVSSSQTQTYVIDYSSPNVAKPMHVGHLRSTIIGNSLVRLLRFLGHRVISDNHLGDWGTQFGMLIYGYKHFRDDEALQADPVREMVRLYLLVRNKIKEEGGEDEDAASSPTAEACRRETAKLHAGDPENVALWKMMMPWCRAELDRIYRRLDVTFDETLGESFYQPMLADVVNDLRAKGIAEPSQGAIIVPFGEDQPPALIQKSDGAFTYMTTDLATIRYRVEKFKPDAILYVVGSPQALHFQYLFAIARRWGYDRVKLEHVPFGSVLGPDRRPFRTREGGTIELESLLQEAVDRARKIVDSNSPHLSESERREVAEVVGIGAVKYADLSQNRTSDYVFSWDKMLAMDGNTATYMQYAYARIRSVFRKGSVDTDGLRRDAPLPILKTPQERALALALLRLEETLVAAAAEYKPHVVTNYLWELANAYSGFYQNCPVLKAETDSLRRSRLLLCDLTARTLKTGLDLLGIRTVEQM